MTSIFNKISLNEGLERKKVRNGNNAKERKKNEKEEMKNEKMRKRKKKEGERNRKMKQ